MAEDFSRQEQNSRKVEENTRRTAENVGRFSESLSKSSKDLQELQNMFTDFAGEISRAAAGSGDLSSAFKNSGKIVNDLAKEAGTLASFTEDGLKNTKDTERALKRQAVVKGKVKQLDSQISLLQDRLVNATEEEADNINKTLETLYLARGESERLLDKFDQLRRTNEKINKETDWIDGISDLVDEVPILRRVFSDFKDAAKEAREASVDGFGAFSAGLTGAFKSLGKLGIGLIISESIKSVNRAQERIKSLTADLNITQQQALEVQSSFVKMAQGITGMTADNLTKSVTEFSKALGASAKPSAEIVKTFATLTQKLGLSVEQATALAKISTVTGMSFDQFSTTITGYTKLQNAGNKVAIRFQDIMTDISGASAATLITTSKFEGGIQRAAYQARRLGLNFKTLEGTTSSLLDFQSSIENELNAELITGRRLNGNRLRMVALMGDQAELAAEIARQAGSEEEFRNMNVIQQEALAKYLGMSRDQLAEMFLEQKALTNFSADEGKTLSDKVKSRQAEIAQLKEQYKITKDQATLDLIRSKENQLIADLGDTQLATQIQNQTLQERMTEAVVKMSDAFVSADGPLGDINESILKLNESLKILGENPESFGGGFAKILTKIRSAAKGLATAISAPFKILFKGASKGFKGIYSVGEAAIKGIGKLFTGIGRFKFRDIEIGLRRAFYNGLRTIRGFKFSEIGIKLSDAFKGGLQTLKGFKFSEIGTKLSDAFKGGLQTLKGFKFSEIGTKLSTAFKGAMTAFNPLKNLPKVLTEGFTKFGKFLATGFTKLAGKGGFKVLLRKIPLLGTLIGLGLAYKRFKEGDYTGAGMEFLSAALTLIPGYGTVASLGVDAALMYTDSKGYTGDPTKRNADSFGYDLAIADQLGRFGMGTPDYPLLFKNQELSRQQAQVAALESNLERMKLGTIDLSHLKPEDQSKAFADITSMLESEKKKLEVLKLELQDYLESRDASSLELPAENINTPKLDTEMPVNDFTIKTHPKDTLVMAGGTKFADDTNKLLEKLISIVEKGGNVYLDGRKVGESLVLGYNAQ